MNILSIFLIAGIILLYSFQTLFCTLYNQRYPGKAEWTSPVFCILEAAFIVLITWALNGFRFHASAPTLIFGCLNALVLFGYNTSLIEAGKRGSYAFFNMSLLYGAILVPMAYSALFLKEKTTLIQWIGIGLMLIAFLFMNWESKGLVKAKKGYYVFCALLFLCNGLYSVFLKMQSVACGEESTEMVMLTFGIMGLVALIRLIRTEKGNTLRAFRQTRQSLWPLALCLLSAGLAINGLVYILPSVNTVVFYTIENGGVLLMSSLYAFLFFHEKPAPRKIAGILVALISITLLSI